MSEYPKDTLQKILALSGIIGPIIYIFILTILGALVPGYCWICQYMSELGAVDSPVGPIMQFAGFTLLGIFWVLFSIGLFRGVKRHPLTYLATIFLLVGSFAMVTVGFFPCDPGCVNVTPIGQMHSMLATIAAIAFVFGMVFIVHPIYQDEDYTGLWWVITLILAILSVIVSPLGMVPMLDPIRGLVQRVGIYIPLIWTIFISIRLYWLTR